MCDQQIFFTMFPVTAALLHVGLVTLTTALPPPTEVATESVDTRVVNREPQQQQEVQKNIAGSLVQDVKQINVLLNIPNNCNADALYEDMVQQIRSCQSGADRGHPDLESGCLLKIDFTSLKNDCRNSKLSFPADTEDIWHPKPTCNGSYCP